MTRINLLTIAVVALLLLNLGLLGFLFFHKPFPPPQGRPLNNREGPKQIIIERLHFDGDQVQQYDALINEHRKTIRGLDEAIMNAKQALYLTLADSASNPNKDLLVNKINGLQKQVEETNYNHFIAIRKLCRPPQLKNFTDLTEELARLFSPERNLPAPR